MKPASETTTSNLSCVHLRAGSVILAKQVEQTYRTVEAIKGQGYTLFHVSPAGHELSFLLRDNKPYENFRQAAVGGGLVGNNPTPRLPGDPRCRPDANRFSAGMARAAPVS